MKAPGPLGAERGSVLIQVLMAAALAMVIVLTLGQMTVMMQRFVSHAQTKLTLFEVRNNILSTVLSDAAWKNTIQHSDNRMDAKRTLCLSGTNGDTPPPIDCSNLKDSLTLVDGSNAVALSKTDVFGGYTRQGEVCHSFDAANGNPLCPIRAEAVWETECVSPCNMRAPPLKISVSFQYNDPAATASINTNQLNFVIRR